MTSEECRLIATRISIACRYDWSDEKLGEFARVLHQSILGSVRFEVVNDTLTLMLSEVDPDAITVAKLIEMVKTRPVMPKRPYLPAPEDASGAAERPIYFPPDNGKEHYPVAHPDEKERERYREFYARAMLPSTVVNRRDLGITQEHIEKANDWRRGEIAKLESGLAAMAARGEDAKLSPDEKQIITDAEKRLELLRYALHRGGQPPKITPLRSTLIKTLTGLGVAMGLHCAGCGKKLDRDEVTSATIALMEAGRRGEKTGRTLCPPCRNEEIDSEIPF